MQTDARRGDMVQIHRVILSPEERAPGLPESTKVVPYEAWVKGFLLAEIATLGDLVQIRTFAGRVIEGELASIEPAYEHGFGRQPVELIRASLEARDLIGRPQ